MAVLSAWIDANSALIGLFVLLTMLVAFAAERMPVVVVGIVAAVAMVPLGFLDRQALLGVFANPAPITIGAMFILSGALARTGALEWVASWVILRARARPRLALTEIAAGSLAASAFMNNTPVVMILIPIMKSLARSLKIGATRLLIPLSYISILGGTLTLIGTSTNLLVDGVAQHQGMASFGIFEITGVGLVTATVGVLFLALTGRWLLPDRKDAAADTNEEQEFLSELTVKQSSDWVGREVGQLPFAGLRGIRVIAIRRGGDYLRDQVETQKVTAGDTLIVAANRTEVVSLMETTGIEIGISGRGSLSIDGGALSPGLAIVEAVIAPTHPVIGRALREVPFLSRLRVRIIGLMRDRHLAGPDLANARVRAGDRLLVAGTDNALHAMRANVNLSDVGVSEIRSFRRSRAPFAVLTMALVVIGAALFGIPIEMAALAGVAIVLATRCIDPEEAWSALDGNVLVLVFAMLAVGVGLQNAGTVGLLVDAVTPSLMHVPPLVLIIATYALASILTEAVTNNAVAVILTPLVIALGQEVGVDPRAMVVAVMFGASASFATPIGYQTNTLVYGAGNYRFSDFLKIGVPMNIVTGIASSCAIYWLF